MSMSFLQIGMTWVVQIIPPLRKNLFSLRIQYHGCWGPDDARIQGITSNDIDLAKPA